MRIYCCSPLSPPVIPHPPLTSFSKRYISRKVLGRISYWELTYCMANFMAVTFTSVNAYSPTYIKFHTLVAFLG